MEQKTILLGATIVLMVALAATLGGFYTYVTVAESAPTLTIGSTPSTSPPSTSPSQREQLGSTITVQVPSSETLNTLTVTGSGVAAVQPDRAKVTMTIFTEALTAEESAQLNSERFNKLLGSLEEAGIPRSQLETTLYQIQPVYYYPPSGSPILKGYMTTHMVKVTVLSGEADGLGTITGKIIDLSVSAGVNRIDSIDFTVSEEKIKELRIESLKSAASDARTKAEAVRSELGIQLIGVHQVSESVQMPIRPYFERGFKEAPAVVAPTELVPGEVKVEASVTIVYIVGQ